MSEACWWRRPGLVAVGGILLLAGCGGSGGDAPRAGVPSLIAFNTVADLLAGDLFEITTRPAVLAELRTRPADWPLAGVGTTALAERNGEVLVVGTVGRPEILWAQPEAPHAAIAITGEPLPFLGLAAGDPATVVSLAAVADQPLHAQVLAAAAAAGMTRAAVRVDGQFRDVSCSVAYNLLPGGTPLTDPNADHTLYQRFFSDPGPAHWQVSGLYTSVPAEQAVLSVPGAPAHLHAARLDRSRAGHLGAATVVEAVIRLYPLPTPVVLQSDLAFGPVAVDRDQVRVTVANEGAMTVSRGTLRLEIAGDGYLDRELFDLAPGERRLAVLTPSWPTAARRGRLVLDPANQVRELREDNNTVDLP